MPGLNKNRKDLLHLRFVYHKPKPTISMKELKLVDFQGENTSFKHFKSRKYMYYLESLKAIV